LDQALEVALPEFLEPLLRSIGVEVIETAKPNVPVQTGELRDSSYVDTYTQGETVKVDYGYSANHAAPVEFGTGNRTPKPYLRPAHDAVVGSGKATQRLKSAIQDKLQGRV
jgi:HK97 gp10 family phage protein